MEGLKPIREGIENLPQAITFLPTQPIGEASGKEEPLDFREIAYSYIYRPDPDKTYGICKKEGLSYIGNKQVTIADNNIMIEDDVFKGTPGLWELITSRRPNDNDYTSKDHENYSRLMIKTNTLYRDNDPKTSHPKSSKSEKWNNLLSPIWFKEKEHKKKI